MSTRPVRIFHIESPSPIDLLKGNAEGPSLRAVVPLLGHKIHSETVRSAAQLRTACRLLHEIANFEDDEKSSPLVLHLSTHGVKKHGLVFGINDRKWTDLIKDLEPFFTIADSYTGSRMLVLSACYAHHHQLANLIASKKANNSEIRPPDYIFSTEREIGWGQATVAWSLFYHLLPEATLSERDTMKDMLDKVYAATTVRIHYHRWNQADSTYKPYTGKTTKEPK